MEALKETTEMYRKQDEELKAESERIETHSAAMRNAPTAIAAAYEKQKGFVQSDLEYGEFVKQNEYLERK